MSGAGEGTLRVFERLGALRGLHALRKASGGATQQFSLSVYEDSTGHHASVPLGHRKMAKNPANPLPGRRSERALEIESFQAADQSPEGAQPRMERRVPRLSSCAGQSGQTGGTRTIEAERGWQSVEAGTRRQFS